MTNPRLRFKNDHCHDWARRKLKECVVLSKGGTLSKSDLDPHGCTPCLLYGELYTAYAEVASCVTSRTSVSKNLIKSRKGDVVLPMSGETAEDIAKATCIQQEGVAYGGDLLVLRSQNCEGIFLSYSINATSRRQILRIAQGKSVVHINPTKVSEIEINTPSFSEQRKIAEFFTTLDEKISLAERKLVSMERLKKGLMQKIFSKEIRFRRDDGTEYPELSDFTVADVANLCGGGTPSTSSPEYWDGNIQWLTPTEIDSKYVHSSRRTITKEGVKNSSAKLLPKGALLLTTRATIGACSIHLYDGDVCTNQGFQSLICKDGVLNEFLYYAVLEPCFQREISIRASGSTFLEISPSNLKKIPIHLPCSDEQHKIASFFTTLDEKIALSKRKITELKRQKQAFMQQMFV